MSTSDEELRKQKQRLASNSWKQRNKEKVKASRKIWDSNNREKINARNRLWAAKNPDTVSTNNKERRLKFVAEFASGERKRADSAKCSICKDVKLAEFFYLSNTNVTGLHGWCKACSDKRTTENGRKRMGLSPTAYADLLVSQGNCCAICGTEKSGKKDFHLDHDHSTGKVRGILCRACNLMIGHANDSVLTLRNAALYLEKYNEDKCEEGTN